MIREDAVRQESDRIPAECLPQDTYKRAIIRASLEERQLAETSVQDMKMARSHGTSASSWHGWAPVVSKGDAGSLAELWHLSDENCGKGL